MSRDGQVDWSNHGCISPDTGCSHPNKHKRDVLGRRASIVYKYYKYIIHLTTHAVFSLCAGRVKHARHQAAADPAPCLFENCLFAAAFRSSVDQNVFPKTPHAQPLWRPLTPNFHHLLHPGARPHLKLRPLAWMVCARGSGIHRIRGRIRVVYSRVALRRSHKA